MGLTVSLTFAKRLSISSDSNGSDDGSFSGLFDGLFPVNTYFRWSLNHIC